MNFFKTLGARIEHSWCHHGFEQNAFAELATECLHGYLQQHSVSPEEILEWVHSTDSLPSQDCVKEEFGDPPIALYHSDHFYIEALFWLAPSTSIHEHSFSGAFYLLAGTSLEVQFDFEPLRRYTERVSIGTLTPRSTNLLAPGAVTPIFPGKRTIHSVVHLGKPSVSIVVRTYHAPEVGMQRTFHHSGLAVDPEYRTDRMRKRIQTLALARRTESPQFVHLARRFMTSLDPLSAYHFVRAMALSCSPAEIGVLLADSALDVHLQSALLGLARERRRQSALLSMMTSITDENLRYFVGLLLSPYRRHELLRLLGSRFPERRPTEVLADWGSRLDELSGAAQSPWDDVSRRVLRLVLEGVGSEALLLRLAAELPEYDIAERGGELRSLERAIRGSALYGPLCDEAAPATLEALAS